MSLLRSVKPIQRDPSPSHTTRGRIVIDDLVVAFSNHPSQRVAVDHVSLDVAPGEFVCVLGPSGCGKSTVLNVVAGFIAPSAGSVSIDDIQIR